MKPLIISVSWQDPDVWSMAVSFDLLMHSVRIQWTHELEVCLLPSRDHVTTDKDHQTGNLSCAALCPGIQHWASWDYPVDLKWTKHSIIMACQNKQLLNHHFLKLITQNMQQLPSFSHESSSCQSLRLNIWYTLGAETFQLHTKPIIIFSYGDFGDCSACRLILLHSRFFTC